MTARKNPSGDKVPPCDLDAEASLLGAAILKPDAVDILIDRTRVDDFYKPAHQHIAAAIHSMAGQHVPVDAVTLADELRRDGLLETIGGHQFLNELVIATPAVSNAGRYAQIVAETGTLRRLIGAGTDISELGYSSWTATGEAIDRARSMIDRLGASNGSTGLLLPDPVDWFELFAREPQDEWLVDGFWPAGRQLHVHAMKKTGKSLIALWIAVCLSIGRDPFTGEPRSPITVTYLDHEMTAEDLVERTEAMGFSPGQLDNLRYYLLPSMPPLDTADGGVRLMQLVERDHARVVIIDTLSRVVQGEENSNDTFQNFYGHTGRRLKLAGVALMRLDHEGHNPGHSRGASAKADDVDVTWRLTATDAGMLFTKSSSRITWVAEHVEIAKTEYPTLAFSVGKPSWPAGTAAKAEQLDQIGAPTKITRRAAIQLLKDAGLEPGRNDILTKAILYRQTEVRTAELFGDHAGDQP
jgi:DnaB-like helicase N terminal domain/AAA domain